MVKTTFEMDGLFTQEDIDNRHLVMRQCRKCAKWTQQNAERKTNTPCKHEDKSGKVCDSTDFDIQSSKSLRTFNPLTDNKRKIK